MIVRDSVSLIASSMTVISGLPRSSLRRSRMRSKMTTVSLIE